MTPAADARADPDQDARFMTAALALGARGLGRTAPNPAVGCVIVARDGRVIARGRTGEGGRPHAEALALEIARRREPEALIGATVYVTLEPCAHKAKTPPCSDALIAAGVGRVVSAVEDPDPRVAGRGHGRLRAAGIAVDIGVGEDEARLAHRGHFLRVAAGRPFVTLKLAMTLDGRIATAAGESQWITSGAARRRAHLMRASHDVVMVGGGTARADDPMLNVRLEGLSEACKPARFILDSNARTPLRGRLMRSIGDCGAVWIAHAPDAPAPAREALSAAGARLFEIPRGSDGRLNIGLALAAAAAAGASRVFCEGGGGVAASLLRAGLVDELVVATAGLAIGGDGAPAVGQMALKQLADAPGMTLADVRNDDGEVWTVWRRSETP